CSLLTSRPRSSPLSPYTPLFRSCPAAHVSADAAALVAADGGRGWRRGARSHLGLERLRQEVEAQVGGETPALGRHHWRRRRRPRSEEHTSGLQALTNLVCRLLP